MMKSTRAILFIFLLVFSGKSFAQLDVFHVLGRGASYYEPAFGVGAYLKFSFPVSEADNITFEGGLNTFDGGDAGYMAGKIGYMYTIDRSGTGFFIEPQLGYSFTGEREDVLDYWITRSLVGPVATLNVGYRTSGRLPIDIAARVESVVNKEGVFGLAGLRIAVPIRFGRNRF